MKFVRALALACALAGSTPLLAQELTQGGVKAFIANIDAAIARRDVDAIVDHIAEHAVVSATVLMQGQTQTLRMNKTQYRQMLTLSWSAASSYEYERTNEKITIDGTQATVTADVSESMVIQGQPFATKARERATVENLDGKLMLTQLVVNQVL